MQVLKEDVKQEIIQRAGKEFVEKGYRGASLRKIADRAGMTVGNIYRYFGNKDELYREVMAPLIGKIEMMKMGLSAHQETPQGSDQEEREHYNIVKNVYSFIDDHRDELKLLMKGSSGSSLEGYLEQLIGWYAAKVLKEIEDELHNLGVEQPEVSQATVYLIAKSVADSLIVCIMENYDYAETAGIAAELQAFYGGGVTALIQQIARNSRK